MDYKKTDSGNVSVVSLWVPADASLTLAEIEAVAKKEFPGIPYERIHVCQSGTDYGVSLIGPSR